MKKAYIAAPWFTPEQYERVEALKTTLLKNSTLYFSPKDENLFGDGKATASEVLDGNLMAIEACDFIIVITDEKDVGTMWEAGFAYAIDKPIVYMWLYRKPGQKFNLMLAASGAVAYNHNELIEHIAFFNQHGFFFIAPYEGEIE
jgi:nucleoside deoxyribosyltransferase